MADSGKKIKVQLKLVIKAGAANPSPPVGSALGPHGINLMQFCKEFNEQTATSTGMIPVVVTVYEDRTFEFVIKTAAVAELVKQTLGITSGSNDPLRKKVATITIQQVKEIAEKKIPDLNSYDLKSSMNQVIGTCRSMGIEITGEIQSVL
jgi:large subunit ribosomal protein L11